MPDVQRYRRGETNPVHTKVATIQAVAIGDLVALSTGFVYRAEDEAYTSLSAAQHGFVSRFAGVSSQRKVSGTATPGTGGGKANRMRVATEGVFEFDTFATTMEVGTLLGPAKAAGSALLSQKLDIVTDTSRAVGAVEETKDIEATTVVKVRIFGNKLLNVIDKV